MNKKRITDPKTAQHFAELQEKAKQEQEKIDAEITENMPLALAIKNAIQSEETTKAFEQFKQQAIAGIKEIINAIEAQLTLTSEESAKLQTILLAALKFAKKVEEVGNDLSDPQIKTLENEFSIKFKPLLLAIDKVFEIKKTLMESTMQGKAPFDQQKIKDGAAQIAIFIQQLLDYLRTKSAESETLGEITE